MTFKSKHKTVCKGGQNGNGQIEAVKEFRVTTSSRCTHNLTLLCQQLRDTLIFILIISFYFYKGTYSLHNGGQDFKIQKLFFYVQNDLISQVPQQLIMHLQVCFSPQLKSASTNSLNVWRKKMCETHKFIDLQIFFNLSHIRNIVL